VPISYPSEEGERGGLPPAGALWWRNMALLAELDLQLDVLVVPATAEAFAPVLALAARAPSLRIVINHIGLL
jgi:predicted TIM-barrel fold metal-dependent hydrolase